MLINRLSRKQTFLKKEFIRLYFVWYSNVRKNNIVSAASVFRDNRLSKYMFLKSLNSRSDLAEAAGNCRICRARS